MWLTNNGTLTTLENVQLSMTNVNASTNTIGSTIISSPITPGSTTITVTNNNFIENVIKHQSQVILLQLLVFALA